MPSENRLRARHAFYSAVRHEREAIELHEEAARRQESIGAELEQRALHEADDQVRDHELEAAEAARRRAGMAKRRAAEARERLRAEGIDPDAGP
jgi:hypothetical protein